MEMNINVDGVPLFKSSNGQLWPILEILHPFPPFIIALYFRSIKLNEADEFIQDFMEEYKRLNSVGFEQGNQTFIVTVNVVIFDTPARQFSKSIRSHNARYACERCVVEGEYFENPVTYLSTRATLYNNDDFKKLIYTDHQIQKSPFIHSGIKCVESFPLDYMHLVCLGVMKRLLLFLKEGLRLCKLSSRYINQISERLEELRDFFRQKLLVKQEDFMTLRDSKLLSLECLCSIQGFLH